MGLSGSGSFTRWQSRCQPGLQLFQGSFGVESISKLPEVVVESIQFVLYYWTEGLRSSPEASLGALSLGPPNRTAYSMTAMSEEVRGQESRGTRQKAESFHLILEVPSCHFCCTLFISNKSLGPAHT